MNRYLIIPLLLIALVVGCNDTFSTGTPVTQLIIPGDYTGLTWVDNGIVTQEVSQPFLNTLWRFQPDGEGLEQIILPGSYEGCERTGFEAPTRLPDGRLGYIRRCDRVDHPVSSLHMMAYDVDSQKVESLVQEMLPVPQIPTGDWTWDPSMTRGITSDGNGRGLAEQLFWFTPENIEYLELGFPQVHGAAWSPDGENIAFVASPEQGLFGTQGWDAVYTLYLMNPVTMELEAIEEGLRYISGVSWSPDSQWLALDAQSGTFLTRKTGIWLKNVQTGEKYLVAEGSFSMPVFSPDGQKLAAIRFPEDFDSTNIQQTEIVIVDVSQFVGSSN